MGLVALVLAGQVFVAAGALVGPRPGRYGWQMYSALSYTPRAWTVVGPDVSELALDGILIHPRSEIDYVDLLRSRGCSLFPADGIRVELPDGTVEEVACR